MSKAVIAKEKAMDRTDRRALVLALVDALRASGSWCGETQAQAAAQQMQGPGAQEMEPVAPIAVARTPIEQPRKISVRDQLNFAPVGTTPPVYQRTQVRSYRKAIEETRQITSNLKRRLERPDLPEAERRFLEQIYAYQLILHQGWKHLSEYKQGDSPRHD